MTERSAAPPRVLCLDGGGIRALSQILILQELMLQVRLENKLDLTPEPRDCFDFICGTEAGGLIAILLGRLGMSLAECEEVFRAFGPKVFRKTSTKIPFNLFIRQWARHKWHKILILLVGSGNMNESGVQGQVPVAVTSLNRWTFDDHLFRTYGDWAHKHCRISDACRATMLSSPTTIINGEDYVAGMLSRNNPSSLALEELESDTWQSPLMDVVYEVGCFVSIGTGRPIFRGPGEALRKRSTLKGVTAVQNALSICSQVTTDSHAEHMKVMKRFKKAGREDVYYRFDVDTGHELDLLSVGRKKWIRRIVTVTKSYLQRTEGELVRCASLLRPELKI